MEGRREERVLDRDTEDFGKWSEVRRRRMALAGDGRRGRRQTGQDRKGQRAMRHLATAKVFLRRPEVKGGGRSMISINIVCISAHRSCISWAIPFINVG